MLSHVWEPRGEWHMGKRYFDCRNCGAYKAEYNALDMVSRTREIVRGRGTVHTQPVRAGGYETSGETGCGSADAC